MNAHAARILELAKSKGLLRTRDVVSVGVPRAALLALTTDGRLLRIGRGMYVLPNHQATEHDAFAEVAVRSDCGVICLLSALRYHERECQDFCVSEVI